MLQNIKTILIVEDEEDLLEMYTRGLSGGGFAVLRAANGIQALEWLEKKYEEINLIVLDIVMPEMDGFETLEKIKSDERFRKIKVIMFTNLDNDDDKKQSLQMGAIDYFVKSQHTPSELVSQAKLLTSD
jgi:DNA-binding response OmpR family regulator